MKEPALSRRHRHRAPGTAPRGELGTGAARRSLSPTNRSRLILVLGLVCAALLIAAPIAFVLSDDPQAGSTREPDGVFTGDDGTGTGSGGGAAGLATTASQTPAPPASDQPLTAEQAAAGGGGGTAGGAPDIGGTGTAGGTGSTAGTGGGTVPNGTAAGSQPGGTGSNPGTGSSPGSGSNPGGGSTPQQPPAEPAPTCPCETIGDVLEDPVGTVEDTVGDVVPQLPGSLG